MDIIHGPLDSGHVQYKTFPARNLYTFYLGHCFTVSFKFSSIFFILLFSQFKKETLVHVFCCQFCEISKNTFFTEHLWTTASVHLKSLFYHIVIAHFSNLTTVTVRGKLFASSKFCVMLRDD